MHCKLFLPLEVMPVDRASFGATLRFGKLGPVSIAESESQPATLEHTATHVERTSDRWFALMMSLHGTIRLSHYGRDIVLDEGDFVLQDSQAPSRMSLPEPNRALTLRLLPETLRAHIPTPEIVCGLRVSGNRGLGRVVRTLLPSLWGQVEEGLPIELGGSLANSLLEVVAASYAMEHRTAVQESAVKGARKAQVKRFVEAHLRDAELSVRAVAVSIGVSPRYVHKLFADEHENLSEYILRRRLEECALQMNSPLWHGHTVTETAVDWGFSSMAHFSRSFKEHFGVSPTEFRRRHTAPTESAATYIPRDR